MPGGILGGAAPPAASPGGPPAPGGLPAPGAAGGPGGGLIPWAADGGRDTPGAPVTAPLVRGIPSCSGL